MQQKRYACNLNTIENFVITLNILKVYNLKVASNEHVPAKVSTYTSTRCNMLWTSTYQKKCVNLQTHTTKSIIICLHHKLRVKNLYRSDHTSIFTHTNGDLISVYILQDVLPTCTCYQCLHTRRGILATCTPDNKEQIN
jgi:hypothetical protein